MRVVVVGAGPAGLSAAHGLAARGVEVTVVEASAEVGGRVRTITAGGRRLELGPAAILDDAEDTRALLGALGAHAPRLIAADARARHRYLLRRGRVRRLPSSPAALLVGGGLTFADRLALLREPFVPLEADAARQTVADFARRRLGATVADELVQPMVVGVFAGDHAALELGSAFPRVAALAARHGSVLRGLIAEARARRRAGRPRPRLVTFEGGMGALPRALAARLGERVRLRCPVRAIERAGEGLRVQVDGEEPLLADRVLLATAPEQAAPLLEALEPRSAALLREIPTVPVASISLGWARADVRHPLDGFGLLVPRGAGLATLGVVFMTSLFPSAGQAPAGEVLLRVLAGGINEPRLDVLSSPELVTRVEREVGELLGARGPATFRHAHLWPQAIAQYTRGHAARAEEVDARLRGLGVELVGTSLRGVGVNDVIRDAAHAVRRLGGGT